MGYSFTFQFSESDIDFSPKSNSFFNYGDFVLNEFFNSTNQEMDTIMYEYYKRYGESAYRYVMSTYYYGWRRGNRTLSNVQRQRIRSIMPEHLNDGAKEKLAQIKEEAKYKLGIEEILGAIKRTVQSFFQIQSNIYSKEKIISTPDLEIIFSKEIIRVKELNIPQQRAFNSEDGFYILNEEEKKEALQIAQYIAYVKLQKQLDQIEKDFNTFLPFMFCIKRGIFTASYLINIFNLKVDFTKTDFKQIEVPKFLIYEIEANSRFKDYSDKYLAHELVSIHKEEKNAIANAFLNSHDLQLFFDHYDELSLSDSEVNMKSTFNGAGGILNTQILMKPIKMLKTSIFKSISKILIYTIISIGVVSIAIRNEWYPILIFGGLIGGAFYISFFSEEVKQIKNLKSEIKQYGQQ